MATLYENFINGTLSAGINSSDTTISASVFSSLPTVASPDILYLVLDADGSAGAPEVVTVTAHTAAATSVTVTRGSQGSTARSHVSGTDVVLDVTSSDLESFLTAVPDASVTTAKLADLAVTEAKLQLRELILTDASAPATTSTTKASFTVTTDPNGWISGGSATDPACPATGLYAFSLNAGAGSGSAVEPSATLRITTGGRTDVTAGAQLTDSGLISDTGWRYLEAGDTIRVDLVTSSGTYTWTNLRVRAWRLD